MLILRGRLVSAALPAPWLVMASFRAAHGRVGIQGGGCLAGGDLALHESRQG